MQATSTKRTPPFLQGMKDGIPIALGYFTVSVSLGIALRAAGLSALQAGIMSATNMTSAGEFAATTVIAAGSGYFLMAMMQLLINARYLLMSCALSQRLDPQLSLGKRLLLGLTVTDEIFALSISLPNDRLDPMYSLGALAVACPGWTFGTVFGVLLGDFLPERLVSALSVALFGMLIAVFIPPTKKSKAVRNTVVISLIVSFVFPYIPLLSKISDGAKLLGLTIVISLVAAILAPVADDKEEDY